MDNWKILPTTLRSALPLLIDTHYARRTPSVSYCFGLYIKDRLEGVVTFGTPPSATLRSTKRQTFFIAGYRPTEQIGQFGEKNICMDRQ